MKQYGWLVCLWLLSIVSGVQASPLLVASSQWPGYTEADGQGVYFEVLRQALRSQGVEFKVQVSNWKRARFAFDQQRADVLVCDYASEHASGVYPKWYLDMDPAVFVFTRQPMPSLQQLKGQSVGWVLGYKFAHLVPSEIQLVEVNSHADGFRLLQGGRLTAVVSYQQHVPADWQGPIFKTQVQAPRPLYPVFQNTVSGRELARLFDQGMQQLQQQGRLQALYPPDVWQRSGLATFDPSSVDR